MCTWSLNCKFLEAERFLEVHTDSHVHAMLISYAYVMCFLDSHGSLVHCRLLG